MSVTEKLINDLKSRQLVLRADRNIYTHCLKDIDSKTLIDNSYPFILRGLQQQATLVEIVVNIGKRIRQSLHLPVDTVASSQIGWFICISYLECGVLSYKLKYTYRKGKRSRYPSYFFVIKNWNSIKELMELIEQEETGSYVYPINETPTPWAGPYNPQGMAIIKKADQNALEAFKDTGSVQMLFDCLNKLQSTGWRINKDIFNVYQYFLAKESTPSPFKLHNETNEEKKRSFKIEAEAIERLALKNLDDTFYHVYSFDFRGRIYVNTAFLHEQSSDNAKGLLIFDKGVPLGDHGLFYLKIHLSNCFGNDKVSLKERADFVDKHLELFISYAEKPTLNQGWIETEAPFCFLAACNELRKIKEWILEGNLVEDYICNLPVYIDGSNNGVQHLVAMSKDETIAHLVNLVPQEQPGDVYMYIANYAWKSLENLADKLTQEEKDRFQEIFETAKRLQTAYENAPDKSEQKNIAYNNAQEWRNNNRSIREKLFPVYWLNISNPKDQRKVVKRNVMTLGYGGTSYGMGQQIIEDTKAMSDYLRDKEHLWGALLGELVFRTCYAKLPGPARMLRMFQEVAERCNESDVFLTWRTPVTNFPVIQGYRKPTVTRTKLLYGDDELKVQLQVWEETTIDKDSSKTGAAPNIVHSFDAAHLAMVLHSAPYEVTVVHDSFGTLPGNMHDLFVRVREKFVEFYDSKPLENLLNQLDSIDLLPPRGNLDISEITKSDYAFC